MPEIQGSIEEIASAKARGGGGEREFYLILVNTSVWLEGQEGRFYCRRIQTACFYSVTERQLMSGLYRWAVRS